MVRRLSLFVAAALLMGLFGRTVGEEARLKVLLLGDRGHHRPELFSKIIGAAMGQAGIDVSYTIDVMELNPENLAKYDAVAIFRDSGELPPKNEAALLDFVENGKGLVAIHCASHCFRNSSRYTALVGGRFWKHGTGTFSAKIIDASHPAMRGLKPFASWDETYRHNEVANDIRVLMVRDESQGYEPYTWVRNQGKGRVFYTALGHDERTWNEAGYHALLANGIKWAAGRLRVREDLQPIEYKEAKIPFYRPAGKGRRGDDKWDQMPLPLSPAESMKHMTTPQGFEVKLFASEPLIQGKPLCMAWDERGRLWLAESIDYPNELQPPGQGRDRIVILEDTNGDGQADKRTVFADKLSIPTSLVFANGGVIVSAAPDMLFLRDTNGDDVADERKVLFTGWGTGDTHAGPSNLRLGPDNWVWGTVGYSGFVGTVGGKEFKIRQGIFRFKPDGSAFEYLTSTSNNTWGLGQTEDGDIFASTANNSHSVYLGIPNRAYESVAGWFGQGSIFAADHKMMHPITDRVRQVDWHGGFTAAAGHAVYTARSFPSEFGNRAAFVCEPTGHLVHVLWLAPEGSSFVTRDGWNILASDDEWTAPIMAEVGPDGSLWVIDWYNYIVQHNPTPNGFQNGKGNAYETPLRDKTHARIYRVVHTESKPSEKPALDTPDQMMAALGSNNFFWRQAAQRLLVDRRKLDVAPKLVALARENDNPAQAVHAVRTLAGLGAPVPPSGLNHASASVRRATLAALPRTAEGAEAIIAAKCLSDADAPVRLAALLALSEMPGSPAVASAVAAMSAEPRNLSDRWIPQAVIAAAAPSAIDFLAQPSAAPEALRIIAGHVVRAQSLDGNRLFKVIAAAKPETAEAILVGVSNAWPAGRKLELSNSAEDLKALASKLTPAALPALATLLKAGGQKELLTSISGELIKTLKGRVYDAKLPDAERLTAAKDLLSVGPDSEADLLLSTVSAKSSADWNRGVFELLGESRSDAIGPAVVGRWEELTPGVRSAAVALLARRPTWASALIDGLEKGKVDKGDLSVDQVQLLTKHPDKALAAKAVEVLARGGRLPNPDRKIVLDKLLPLASKTGDKNRGRAVFEANCAKCHRHGELGNSVGPDLTGMAVRERAELLTEILDPNRSVEGNYQQYSVTTKKGQNLQGLLASETKTAIELLDGEAKRHVILREDIEDLFNTKRSLMPEGFESIPPEDLTSLLEFLAARDRYLPLPLTKAATITSVKGMFIDKANEVERLIFPKWGTNTFNGVPFQVIDPQGGSVSNVIELYSPNGGVSRQMPKSATVPCNAPVKTLHLLSGVGGWSSQGQETGTVSMIVRLVYADGSTEDHPLKDGIHFADYIRVVNVPESKLAFNLKGRQVRYLAISPAKPASKIERIEFVKGADRSAPVVVAVTAEIGG